MDLEYSTVGQYLVVGTDQAAEAWDVKGGLTYQCGMSKWPLITFSPTAEIAAVSCAPFEEDSYQFLWDLESGKFSPDCRGARKYIPRELRFSMDGRLLVGLSDGGKISIWNGETGEYLTTHPEPFGAPLGRQFYRGWQADRSLA